MNSALTSAKLSATDFISFAQKLAEASRRETLTRFSRDYVVENKAGSDAFDPVTDADRASERVMRSLIENHFEDHGIQGEEFGDRPGSSRYCWSLDPIDGTRSFVCGLPSWVTLIALLDDGKPVMGLIDNPCLDELYLGTEAQAFMQKGAVKKRIETSACSLLAEARLSTTDPYLFQGSALEAFDRIRSSSRTMRLGHDGYAYARLAAGTLDLVIECGLKPHDYNALIPIVRGAGGVFGDWEGGSDFASGNVVAAATPRLYDAAVAIMRSSGAQNDAP